MKMTKKYLKLINYSELMESTPVFSIQRTERTIREIIRVVVLL